MNCKFDVTVRVNIKLPTFRFDNDMPTFRKFLADGHFKCFDKRVGLYSNIHPGTPPKVYLIITDGLFMAVWDIRMNEDVIYTKDALEIEKRVKERSKNWEFTFVDGEGGEINANFEEISNIRILEEVKE